MEKFLLIPGKHHAFAKNKGAEAGLGDDLTGDVRCPQAWYTVISCLI